MEQLAESILNTITSSGVEFTSTITRTGDTFEVTLTCTDGLHVIFEGMGEPQREITISFNELRIINNKATFALEHTSPFGKVITFVQVVGLDTENPEVVFAPTEV